MANVSIPMSDPVLVQAEDYELRSYRAVPSKGDLRADSIGLDETDSAPKGMISEIRQSKSAGADCSP